MSEEMSQRAREVRAAQNQSLFRSVNENLEGLAAAFQFIAQTSSFVCECADVDCVSRIELPLDDYEAVRAAGNRFVVLPDHVYPDVERVVGENAGFVIVEKLAAAAEVAEAEDGR